MTQPTFIDTAVSSGDFSDVVQLKKQRMLTDQEKYYLLDKHFRPSSSYKFPSIMYSGRNRSFQHNWLSQYNGLVYSEKEQGGYCKYCILFGQAAHSMASFTGTLITLPLTNLQKASEKLREHFGKSKTSAKKYHLAAVEKALTFKNIMENRQLSIDQQLSTIRAQSIANNRMKLEAIVKTIIFCGRQGIALRGHRDDWAHVTEMPHANHGNFIALLNFRIDSGDKVLAEHFQTAKHNALYTSKTIQNEIIEVCGHVIRTTILDDIRNAGIFSVMADETADIANKEQLAISIRYVNKNTKVIEEKFLGYSECETGVTGSAIADRILQHLADWQLPATKLRGQTYDGAGAMAGKRKGAAARIVELYPKALYSHCASHILNLCIVKCCTILEVRNTMDICDSIYRFFANSPKRQLALTKCIEETTEGERRKKLKSLCKTRWVERHEAFEVFVDLYQSVVYCMEEIKDLPGEWNRETRSDAQSFFISLSRFPTICALVLTKEVLSYTKALSIKLQGRYIDIVKAYQEIDLVKSILKDARKNIDGFHSRVYKKALDVAAKVKVEESLPRTTGRQQHRSNVPAVSAVQYYQRLLTIPMLDYLINDIEERFSDNVSDCVCQFMLLLPPALADRKEVLQSTDINALVVLYDDDLPTPTAIDAELHCWSIKWKGKVQEAQEQDTPAKVLATLDKDFFPNIEQLLKIACTLSVTSVECERSISRLRYLKTNLRSTMLESRLNGLAMMYVHRDIPCDPNVVIDEFARKHPRRMTL